MMRNRKLLIAALVIAVAAVGAWLIFKPPAHDSSVKVAVNIPTSGPIASFSGEWPNGLRFGIEDGCTEFGVPRDSFALDVQDNQGKPSQAVSIAQRQVSNGFNIYASGVSQMSAAIANQIDAFESVPHFLISYDARLVATGKNRMRLLPHFKIEAPVYVKYAEMRSAKKVFAFTLNNPEINDQFDSFVGPELKEHGIAFQKELYEFDHTDWNTLAAKAKKEAPDLIFVSGFSVHVFPIVKALRTQDIIQNGNVLCIMDFNELLLNNTPKEELKNIAFMAPPFEFPENAEKRAAWSKRYQERFKIVPNFIPAYGYDTGKLLVKVFKEKASVSKDAIMAALPYDGVAGRITVDQYGDLNAPLGILKVRVDGSLERLY